MDKFDQTPIRDWRQFSLLSLFELTTLCCLLAASISLLGIETVASLMLFAVSLHYRWGLLSISSLVTILLMASAPSGLAEEGAFVRQAAAVLAATLVCAWYWFRYVAPLVWAQKNPEQPAQGSVFDC